MALVLDVPFAELVIGNYVNTSVPRDVMVEEPGSNLNGKTDSQGICQAVQTRAMKKQEKEVEEKVQASINKLHKDDSSQKLTEASKLYSKDELKHAQTEDGSLDKVRQMVTDSPGQQPTYFILKSGILYRVFVAPSGIETHQIVLPQKYRKTVLEFAHDIPLSGHLGMKKTRDRILQHYFWPGIFHDVEIYCKSCTVCQLSSSKGKSAKVPLVSIPPIDVPFKRIAIDFIRQIPLTERKNRYILVCRPCHSLPRGCRAEKSRC